MFKGVGQIRARRATGQSCSDAMSYGDDIPEGDEPVPTVREREDGDE